MTAIATDRRVRVETTRGQLLPILTGLGTIVRRPHVATLAGALIDATTGTITATDYETWLRCPVPVEGEGQALLPVHSLLAAVKTGPKTKAGMAQPVVITVSLGHASVSVGGVTVPLTVLPAEDYPAWPLSEGETLIQTTAEAWRTAWAGTVWAVCKDMTLPILSGVYLTCSEDHIKMWATDRYRAAQHPVDGQASAAWAGVIPDRITKLLPLLQGQVEIKGHGIGYDQGLSFNDGAGNVLYTRVLDGEYPKIGSIWPEGYTDHLEFDRDAMVAAVKQVQPHIERNAGVLLNATARFIEVSARTDDGDVIGPKVPYDGGAIEFSLNPQFLLDVLKALPAGPVRVSYVNASKPFRFESGTAPLDAIQMPIRLT